MPTQEPTDEFQPNRATRRAQEKSNRATLKALLGKKLKEREITIKVDDEELTLLLRALSSAEWDALMAEHEPTKKQKEDGQQFNIDTFPPALLSRVCVEPAISEADWAEIWASDTWSRGELSDLYGTAVSLCTAGFNIPFIAGA